MLKYILNVRFNKNKVQSSIFSKTMMTKGTESGGITAKGDEQCFIIFLQIVYYFKTLWVKLFTKKLKLKMSVKKYE